jgi:hypothetical protein
LPKPQQPNSNDGEVTIENSIPSTEQSPFEKVAKFREYSDLCNESKKIIAIVLDTPKEYFHLITTETGLITKNSVKYFLEKRWPTFIVNHVMEELKTWVSHF